MSEIKHEVQDIIEEYELGLIEAGLKVNVDIDYDKLAEARQLVWKRLEDYLANKNPQKGEDNGDN
jgi:hypothetical protein